MSGIIRNNNKACCTIPPVQSKYTPKGYMKSYGAFNRVYVTGPDKSENAIVCVFDIFGFFPQTKQGADIVSSALNTTVFMPDFFEPKNPLPYKRYPPENAEEQKVQDDFFGPEGAGHFPTCIAKLIEFGKKLKSDGYQRVGAYGFCWGGKVVISACAQSTPFASASIIHPAFLSVDDAHKLTVPLGMYISKDDDYDEYTKIIDVISKKPFAAKSDNKYYSNMHHGWAAARSDLEDEENKKEFEDLYAKLVEFFDTSLT